MRDRKRRSANPFWALVLLVGFLFAITCLVAIVGSVRPDSPLNAAFDRWGTAAILLEAGCLVTFGLLAMTLDRMQTLRSVRADGHDSMAPEVDSST
jgi:hypothetical protein